MAARQASKPLPSVSAWASGNCGDCSTSIWARRRSRVAQTRRVLFAKQLIAETSLSMAEIAEASGFGSVRRFNDTFSKLYRHTPRELRRKQRVAPSAVRLRLGYRPPYDWDAMLSFLAARAITGVELIDNNRYCRTIAVDDAVGSVRLHPAAIA